MEKKRTRIPFRHRHMSTAILGVVCLFASRGSGRPSCGPPPPSNTPSYTTPLREYGTHYSVPSSKGGTKHQAMKMHGQLLYLENPISRHLGILYFVIMSRHLRLRPSRPLPRICNRRK
ncbi:hypothetical protein QBC35DRAFT_486306 [Podospora australis]|uniref:Secreted protein n=1 Tax=Podospora australis TaxID=1536484 RepID=A0AAN7ANJ8_9PEZI|nr:hypothetical protein QBC35DRAFT_486306 [Podospora australis]